MCSRLLNSAAGAGPTAVFPIRGRDSACPVPDVTKSISDVNVAGPADTDHLCHRFQAGRHPAHRWGREPRAGEFTQAAFCCLELGAPRLLACACRRRGRHAAPGSLSSWLARHAETKGAHLRTQPCFRRCTRRRMESSFLPCEGTRTQSSALHSRRMASASPRAARTSM